MNSVQLALSPFDIFVFYMVAGVGFILRWSSEKTSENESLCLSYFTHVAICS